MPIREVPVAAAVRATVSDEPVFITTLNVLPLITASDIVAVTFIVAPSP